MLHFIDKRWEKFYLASKCLFIVTTLHILLILSIAIMTLVLPPACDVVSDECKQFVVNQAIALFVWSLFFYISVCDGLFWGNIYELYAAMFLSIFITAWSIWRKLEPHVNNYLEYMFVITNALAQICYFSISYYLYKEYRWVLWKKAGSDETVQAMYGNYLKWSCFQKLDMTFAGFCILLSGQGAFNTGWESALDIVMLLILIATIISGYVFVKQEYSILTKLWFLLLPIMPGYIIAWFILQKNFDTNGSYSLYIPFIVCGCFLLITRLILVYYTVLLLTSYGKGLKDLTKTVDQTEITVIEEDEGENYFENEPNDADSTNVNLQY